VTPLAGLLAALAAAGALAVGAQPGTQTDSVSAFNIAKHLAGWGPRPAAGTAEARAHRLVARVLERAGLRVGNQTFEVPGHGRSRNVIGVYDTDAACLDIVMAHTDSTPNAPGANDNASGVGVVAELAGRLARIGPACDFWLAGSSWRVGARPPRPCPRRPVASPHGPVSRRGRRRPAVLAALAGLLTTPLRRT
jgi:Peptidase family M28